ncbi:MAG: acetamidase/formamidase family protein [Chloroflexi bacterium]|nr:acetamidase/formamidase family protein [Chloroflexota bacterium]MCH8352036.1 acetamidase/formamidase family protein [Chloroflexota bacterium]MCI0859469.1 acetamidase/formamidase family protein [Chloroflexota bacterium]
MKRLGRENHIYVLDAEVPPAITIDSGEELMVETWDAFEGERDPAVLDARSLKGPASGSIYVNGAEPGDALRVEFLSITPKEEATHMVMPGRGFLEQEFTEAYATIVKLEGGHAVLPSGVRLPLNPSMGLVATTPTYVQSTASDSGPYGGDIDMKELVAGSTLFLPVFVPGGLLALGDCHAVVGDGAVAGTGAECSADTHLRVTVEKGMGIASPRALTPDHYVVLSYGDDLGTAMRQAVREMVDFLVKDKGMAPYDAYTLLSLAGDVRVSRTFRPISPVKMMLSRQALDQL